MRAATRSAALRTNSAKPDQIRDQLARESCRIPEHPRGNKAGPTEAGQAQRIPQITPSKNRPHLPDTDGTMNEIERPRSTRTTRTERDHGNGKIRSRIGRPNRRSDQRRVDGGRGEIRRMVVTEIAAPAVVCARWARWSPLLFLCPPRAGFLPGSGSVAGGGEKWRREKIGRAHV